MLPASFPVRDMGDASSSRLDRLALLPALILAAYVLFTLPASGSGADTIQIRAGQPYAQTGRGQANVVRPERLQLRAADVFDPGRDDNVDAPDLVLPATVAAFASAGAMLGACAAPIQSRRRTHNPRDPPAAA
jgi:hypothetical protein